MLYVPQGPDFQWYYSNTLATRPVAAFGATVTPNTTANTYGAWQPLATGANLINDVWGILLCINNCASSNNDRRALVNIGVDNSGSTNYRIVIPALMAGKASPYTASPSGIWYYFPLFIPAGSQVAAQSTASVATTFSVSAYFFGQPRRPDAVRTGSYVDVYGLTSATRVGTTITPGTTAEGAFTASLATTTRPAWWWQLGVGMETNAINAQVLHFDLVGGSSTTDQKFLLENQVWSSTTTEQLGCLPITVNSYNNLASGSNLYARAQSSGTINTTSVVAYALGG